MTLDAYAAECMEYSHSRRVCGGLALSDEGVGDEGVGWMRR